MNNDSGHEEQPGASGYPTPVWHDPTQVTPAPEHPTGEIPTAGAPTAEVPTAGSGITG